MIFASDNWAGAEPRINEAILANTSGFRYGYNGGELDQKVTARLCELFETDLSVLFVATGTAANSLCIAATASAGSVCFAHEESHVMIDECGAPEFFSASRLCGVPGNHGKMDPRELRKAIARYPACFLHHGRPGSVTITQATELGTVHSLGEITAIAEIARENSLPLHMDGARFANALVSLDASPAQMTWKAGVDLLSFGGTKNGCWCAEAVICFDSSLAEELRFHHKRAGQLFSKSRFIAAQFDAYLADDHWLDMARHANRLAMRLADGVRQLPAARLALEPDANEVFVIMKRKTAASLREKGAVFFEWQVPAAGSNWLASDDEELYRFVTSFATHEADVDTFLAALQDA